MSLLVILAIVIFIVLYNSKKKDPKNEVDLSTKSNETDAERTYRLVNEKQEKARKLGIPELVSEVAHNYLSHYPSWFNNEKNRSWVYPKVQNVRKIDGGGIEIEIDNSKYILKGAEKWISTPDGSEKHGLLEVFQNDKKILGLNESWNCDQYSDWWTPFNIEAYIEGDWIKDFQEIKKFHEERNKRFLDEQKNDPNKIKNLKDNFGLS